MDKPFLVGWYECRTTTSPSRIVRYWNGTRLLHSPDDFTCLCLDNYTDFRGTLIEDHPAATALAFLIVKLRMGQLDREAVVKVCEEALAKCKGNPIQNEVTP